MKKKTSIVRAIKDFLSIEPLLLRLCKPKKQKKTRKVYETPLRSFLKTMGFRVVEVLVDTVLLQTINPEVQENLVIAISIELVCWVISFIWERLWNLTDFGRIVKQKCPHCDKEIS